MNLVKYLGYNGNSQYTWVYPASIVVGFILCFLGFVFMSLNTVVAFFIMLAAFLWLLLIMRIRRWYYYCE